MKNLPQRTSPRRKEYDYGSPGAYFVTICTARRQHYFGEVEHGFMILNDLGIYCNQYLQHLVLQRSTIEIHEYIIMPNHVHLLLMISEFTPSMNTGYIDRRDALLGRPNEGDISDGNEQIQKNNGHNCNENDHNNFDINGHAKSVSLQQEPVYRYNPDYHGPTLGSIINMFKGAVTKYAKSGVKIPYGDTFARQPRYHDRIIRNEDEYEKIKYYIQTNPQNRESDTFNK